MRQILFALIITALLLAVISCSGGGNGSSLVTEPGMAPGTTGQEGQSQSHNFWGLWQFVADPDKGTLEITPLRGGDFHLNALVFLEPPPFANLSLESLVFNGNIVEADIGLRHPFLGLTEFTGFDVCGILITNGSVTGFDDPDLRMAGDTDTHLLNPDGYSRWWNPAEFPHGSTMTSYKDGLLGTPDSIGNYNCTLNAYKYFCDNLVPGDPLSDVTLGNRGMFSAGKKNIRHYSIDMGAGLVFNYAVDGCWEFPAGVSPWTAPDDFPPAANRQEAWRVEVTEVDNTLWNDGSESGGGLYLSVDVYDWFNADMNSVKVESSGNFTPVTSDTAISGGAGFSTYEIEVLDATPAEGSIDLLISVACENTGYGGLLPGKPVTAYFMHSADVSPDKPPEVEFPVVIDEDPNYRAGRFVQDSKGVFHVVASYDNTVAVPKDIQFRWFISTDDGGTWEYKGILNEGMTYGTFEIASWWGHQLAADENGHVYMLWGTRKISSNSTPLPGYLMYLDTDDSGGSPIPPGNWTTANWTQKRVYTSSSNGWGGTSQNAIAVSDSDPAAIMMFTYDVRGTVTSSQGFQYHYAASWDALPATSTGTFVCTNVNGGHFVSSWIHMGDTNPIVYHPDTGHFFFTLGGLFTISPYSLRTGACVLEFDPSAGGNKLTMVAAAQCPNLVVSNNSVFQVYNGDLAVDSAGFVQWVHVIFWQNPPVTYNWDYHQFRFIHGYRDGSGVWDVSDNPINGDWQYPSSPPGGTPYNCVNNEPSCVNIVNTSNGILLAWRDNCVERNYRSSRLVGGAFQSSMVQLDGTVYPIVCPGALNAGRTSTAWYMQQAAAVDDKMALPFVPDANISTYAGKGPLMFTMFDGM